MLNIFFRVFNKFGLMVLEPVSEFIAQYYLAAVGVNFGKRLRMSGCPTVSIFPNSRIVLGDDVTLLSNSKRNAIGVNHEVILRTQGVNALIKIGSRVGMSGGAICARARVVIGDDVLIGSNVVIADNDFHAIDAMDRKNGDHGILAEEIVIGNGVWIGADVYVCKGVTIGENSVIGAKSVVTKSVPPNCVAAGIPAKVVKTLEKG